MVLMQPGRRPSLRMGQNWCEQDQRAHRAIESRSQRPSGPKQARRACRVAIFALVMQASDNHEVHFEKTLPFSLFLECYALHTACNC